MLTWDDEDGEYYAGQLLKGRIEVTANISLDVVQICIDFYIAGPREEDYEVQRSLPQGKTFNKKLSTCVTR